MKKLPEIIVLCSAVLALGGCSGAKERLGLTHNAPDAFAVVKRAPLEMPPDYTLRPPSPGAERPQEAAVGEQARAVVFGGEEKAKPAASQTSGSAVDHLLQKTGGEAADPSIRRAVDQEAAKGEKDDRPVAEKLLGWTSGEKGEPVSSVVDAAAEAERLKKNEEEGKPVTEGQTPSKTQ